MQRVTIPHFTIPLLYRANLIKAPGFSGRQETQKQRDVLNMPNTCWRPAPWAERGAMFAGSWHGLVSEVWEEPLKCIIVS